VNLPGTELLRLEGGFLDAEDLRERFAGVGVFDGVEVGAYCGSGVTAALEVLALSVAGFDGALYVGSWSDWIRDPARPVATGG
jgi:thiosulfate/3-mercaptopyruvate sulfurtransferase